MRATHGLPAHLAVRTHLILYFIVATLLIAGLVGVNASSSFHAARDAAANSVIAELNWQTQDMTSAARSIPAQLRSVVKLSPVHALDPVGCAKALRDFAALAGSTHVLVVGHGGTILCTDGSTDHARSLDNGQLLTDIFGADRALGGPVPDPVTGAPDLWYAKTFRSPGNGRVALVGMGPVQQMAAMSTHNSVDAYLVNARTGKIFSVPPSVPQMRGTSLDQATLSTLLGGHRTVTEVTGDGVRRIIAAERVPGTDWAVIAGVPYNHAIAPARHDLLRNMLVGGLIVLVLLALGLALQRRISKPLGRLRRAMERVGDENPGDRAPVSGPAEFRELATTFNEMLDARARSEARFRSLARYDSDYVTIVDADGAITYANPRATTAFEIDPAAPTPNQFVDLVQGQDQSYVARLMRDWMQSPPGSNDVAQFQLVTRTGEVRDVEATVQNLLDDPAVSGLIVTCNDITERKAAEDRLTHAALHDSLTGLPNRPLVMDRLEHVLERSRRDGTLSAVLFLDLDNFKLINDTAGHGAGDALLVQVAERLSSMLRPGDTLGRCGGDEFVVICESVTGAKDAEAIGTRLIETREQPYVVNGQDVYIGASVGIALAGPGDNPSSLLRDADSAMYAAKTAGRSTARVFDDAMRVATTTRLDLENALQRALERGELSLHYQPLVAVDDRRTVGFEALLRWHLADGTVIAPDEFIPIAEETGLIIPIGEWVLDEACRQLAAWTKSSTVPPTGKLSVNVSARQLSHPSFPAVVAGALDRHGLSPTRLVVELTESTVMQDAVSSLATLRELHALGVRIAVDDFGTGYSSLGYLERLPIDELKIDRSFVSPLSTGSRTSSIVESIVTLGHALGLTVTAEGVETSAQLGSLEQIGCDLAQGFLLARPMLPAQVITWLADRAADPGTPQRRTRTRSVTVRHARPFGG